MIRWCRNHPGGCSAEQAALIPGSLIPEFHFSEVKVVSTGWIIFFVILGILVAATIVLYFLGKRAEKRQAEQQEQIEAHKQTVSLLIIDKKKMRLRDAGRPSSIRRRSCCAAPRCR